MMLREGEKVEDELAHSRGKIEENRWSPCSVPSVSCVNGNQSWLEVWWKGR